MSNSDLAFDDVANLRLSMLTANTNHCVQGVEVCANYNKHDEHAVFNQ